MKRIAGAIVVAAAAAALALPGAASAADTTTGPPDLECEKQLIAAIPGFAVYVVNYTLEHGEPPFLGGPFYPC